MYYTKTDDYDAFRCIADKCPQSCCIGWQIVIDEESLERYAKEKSPFGDRLRNSIDWEEGVYYQSDDKRCAMLCENGLCEQQLTLGEESLCHTCTQYPRHMEEFEDVREYSLSLSCPEVARTLVERVEPMGYVEWEDSKEDDFEEFDFLLYDKICAAREVVLLIAQNRSLSMNQRMTLVLDIAKNLQKYLDEDEIFEMDDYLDQWKEDVEDTGKCSSLANLLLQEYDVTFEKNTFSHLYELESLSDDWFGYIDAVREASFALDVIVGPYEIAAEQIFVSLIFTYFCGAVYDDMIYAKAALCAFSVRWIFALFEALPEEKKDKEALIFMTYRFAREIEHSDLNMNSLQSLFDSFV